ncbi:MAG: YqaJ viral recombinase family protein, partial [Phaeodactylibacter sp.]|nr:YqaJ viral recombinase family protein [Phaeodactylibacter sp.]
PVQEEVVQPVQEEVVQPVQEEVVQPVQEEVVQPVQEEVVQPREGPLKSSDASLAASAPSFPSEVTPTQVTSSQPIEAPVTIPMEVPIEIATQEAPRPRREAREPTFEQVVAREAPTPTVSSTTLTEEQKTSVATDYFTAKGLEVSNFEQGSQGWLDARNKVLTSTGVATSMDSPVYKGNTWKRDLEKAVMADKAGVTEEDFNSSDPMFAAGTAGEEAGKRWFSEEMSSRSKDGTSYSVADLGMISDPSKPNQGTSLDGVILRNDEVGDKLDLTEFKWGTQGRMPAGGVDKHQQQLQHQMYMTGAESNTLVTGFDPNQFNAKRGTESEFEWMSTNVKRDPEWAENNADFIQARANEKASAVESGDANSVRDGYLEALKERYPNESDKGLTKDEKAQKKLEEQQVKEEDKADKLEQKQLAAEDRVTAKRTSDTLHFMAGGSGNANLRGVTDLLGRFGVAGKVSAAAIGVGTAAYDAVRGTNNMVGEAADVGAESTQAFKASDTALRSLSFSDGQASSMNQSTVSAQALASVGEYDPLVKKLTAYRGLVSMEELQNLSPEERTVLTRNRADEQGITGQQLSGMALMAGDDGMARDFQTDAQEKSILETAAIRGQKGAEQEQDLRANVGTMNVEAVNLNIKDAATESLLDAGGNPTIDRPEDSRSNWNPSKWVDNVSRGAEWLVDGATGGFFGKGDSTYDGAAAEEKAKQDMMSMYTDRDYGAYNVVGDTTQKQSNNININVDSSITKEQTTTEVTATLNEQPAVRSSTVSKEE